MCSALACALVDAPAACGPCKTLTNRCRRWSEKGIVQLILSELARSAGTEAEADTAPEAGVEPEEGADDQCHLRQSPLHRLQPEKGGADPRWIGRTTGGLTSKRPVVCDGKGRPVRLLLSEGQRSDFTGAELLLQDLPEANVLIGDKGYDSSKIGAMVLEQGMTPCIPSRRNRTKRLPHSKRLYKKRHQVENLFVRLKDAPTTVPTCSSLPSSWRPPSSSGDES